MLPMLGALQPKKYLNDLLTGLALTVRSLPGQLGLVSLLGFTALIAFLLFHELELETEQRFAELTEEVTSSITRDLESYESAALQASHLVELTEPNAHSWEEFGASIADRFALRGYSSLWYVAQIPRESHIDFARSIREDVAHYPAAYRTFALSSDLPLDTYSAVLLAFPLDTEKGWLGAELHAVEPLRTAIEKARDTGRPMVALRPAVSAGDSVVSIVVPLFRRGEAYGSVLDRRANVRGFIVLSFDPRVLVTSRLLQFGASGLLGIRIFNPSVGSDTVIFNAAGAERRGRFDTLLERTNEVSIEGDTWTLVSTVYARALLSNGGAPFVVGMLTLAVGLLCLGTIVIGIAHLRAKEAKRTESIALDALSRRDEQLRILSESSPVPVCVVNSTLECVFFNTAFQEILRLPFSRLGGEGWLVVVEPDDLERLREKLKTAQQLGTGFDEMVKLRSNEGQSNLLRVRATPIRSGKQVMSFLLSFSDEARLRDLEHTLAVEREERARLEEDRNAMAELLRLAETAREDLLARARTFEEERKAFASKSQGVGDDERRQLLEYIERIRRSLTEAEVKLAHLTDEHQELMLERDILEGERDRAVSELESFRSESVRPKQPDAEPVREMRLLRDELEQLRRAALHQESALLELSRASRAQLGELDELRRRDSGSRPTPKSSSEPPADVERLKARAAGDRRRVRELSASLERVKSVSLKERRANRLLKRKLRHLRDEKRREDASVPSAEVPNSSAPPHVPPDLVWDMLRREIERQSPLSGAAPEGVARPPGHAAKRGGVVGGLERVLHGGASTFWQMLSGDIRKPPEDGGGRED